MAAELYFTGKPCKRGHIAQRFKSTGTCVECNRENVKRINSTPEQIAKRKAREKPSPNATENWRRWYALNPKAALTHVRSQQALRLKRVPAWSEKELIQQFYEDCPEGYEVDHVIPLQGKTVSGLHVLSNLQYLPMMENRTKGNKVTT